MWFLLQSLVLVLVSCSYFFFLAGHMSFYAAIALNDRPQITIAPPHAGCVLSQAGAICPCALKRKKIFFKGYTRLNSKRVLIAALFNHPTFLKSNLKNSGYIPGFYQIAQCL